ncbi:MAG TPA: peptidoglycan DD-metalloendopeptidase family protein [Stellaceae bacterium]|nr:peptidoglycan DD-metalloendopeptidase family protein [Stellaceae bacterium]
MLASVAGVAVIAAAFATAGYLHHARGAADAKLAASRVESANIDLQDELARLRDQVATSTRDLAAAQNRVVALTEEVHAHAQAQPAPAPEAAAAPAKAGDKSVQLAQQLHVAEAQRATLAARLSKAEADLADQQAKQTELLGQIDQWQKKLEQLSSDRDRLKARVGELEKQSALKHAQQQQVAQAARPGVAAVATMAMAAPRPQVAPQAVTPQAVTPQAVAPQAVAPQPQAALQPQGEAGRVAGVLNAPPQPTTVPAPPVAAVASAAAAVVTAPVVVAHGAIDQFARVLASAGVDVRHLFAEYGVNRGEGGPFIPAPRGAAMPDQLTPEKLAALRAMVKVLPVSAPLESYRVTSPFGVREDPENERAGFHTGIDLAAPYDTPVYATAPGVVTYAGYRDDYGKIVEIDHGNGIATRYAHLHSFTVSVGQRVGVHQQVGYLGSTGRATGPHVHYEVVVNGEPQDPEKFFGLARYVQSATLPVSLTK